MFNIKKYEKNLFKDDNEMDQCAMIFVEEIRKSRRREVPTEEEDTQLNLQNVINKESSNNKTTRIDANSTNNDRSNNGVNS